jgi:hypothetical protein
MFFMLAATETAGSLAISWAGLQAARLAVLSTFQRFHLHTNIDFL